MICVETLVNISSCGEKKMNEDEPLNTIARLAYRRALIGKNRKLAMNSWEGAKSFWSKHTNSRFIPWPLAG